MLTAALVVLAAPGGAARGEDAPSEPPPQDAEIPWSDLSGDPGGEATRLDAEALALLRPGPAGPADPATAAERWMDLAELDPAALLPAPPESAPRGQTRPTEGLWWPAREVALVRLAGLPAAGRDAVERRWGPRAAEALARGMATRARGPLERAARAYPVTRAGSQALLALAEADLEAGHGVEAAGRLERWLRLNPAAGDAHRAGVTARWLDAMVLAKDEAGLRLVSQRLGGLAAVPVARADGDAPLERRASEALLRVRARIAADARAEEAGPDLPRSPTLLWSRSLSDAGLLGPDSTPGEAAPPSCAIAADGGAVYVDEDRVLERLDAASGRLRWTYPDRDRLPREWSWRERYRPWEEPVRAVVPAGDRVLAVMGDPPAPSTSMFLHRNSPVHPEHLGREARARLVALRAEDGAPLWVTGTPTESDPVLGAPDVAVSSPPLVETDRVLVVLSARRGAVESWLACLDLGTGRPRWVTPLGRGESGLDSPAEERALFEPRMRAVPRAQRPSRAGDEVCVVTGAGYAAGVSAPDGRLLWTRALPRYRYEEQSPGELPPPGRGFSARNVPVAAYGAWYLAAPDAPVLVCVERGSGRLRWTAAPRPRPDTERSEGLPDAPECQHLLGVGATEDGQGTLRLAGEERALEVLRASTGAWRETPGFPGWRPGEPTSEAEAARPGAAARGRPWAEGRRVVASRGGALRASTWPARLRDAAPWSEDPEAARDVEGRSFPSGDVVRAGDVWFVVGANRLVALAASEVADALEKAPPKDPVDAALVACSVARKRPSPQALQAAARAVASGRTPDTEQGLSDAADALLGGPRGLLRSPRPEAVLDVLDAVDTLSPPWRAAAYLEAARGLVRRGRHEALVALADRWVSWGDACTVDVEPGGRVAVRGDLYAVATLLPFAEGTVEGRTALARREATAEVEVAAAAQRGTDDLGRAVRRWAGTVAAWAGRVRLAGALLDAGRYGEAAAAAADARISRPPSVAVRLSTAAALRALEADALARAGESEAAREALDEARMAGGAWARALDGDAGGFLAARLAAATAFVPSGSTVERVLPAWPEGGPPSDAARLTACAVAPFGPGAGPDLGTALLARGLSLTLWSLKDGRSVPLPAADEGFLGVGLLDREPAVPGPGVLVSSVVPGSEADRAGLRQGDWILAFSGRAVADRNDLTDAVARAAEGAPVAIDVVRHGTHLALSMPVGRRTARDRPPSVPDRAYVTEDDAWIVPTRLGLRRVDPRTGQGTPLWRWTGAGDVLGSLGTAGTLVVWTACAPLDDGFVVAVDVAGVERWRTPIGGRILHPPRPVGSAFVVDAADPDRTWVLDAADGSVRGVYGRAETFLPSVAPAPVPAPPPTAVAGGCVHLLRENRADGSVWLVSLDPATACPTWERRADPGPLATRLFPPHLAGGSVLALAVADDEITVTVPDLRGGTRTVEPLRLDAARFDAPRWGPIETDSRVAVAGDTVYLMRTSRDRRASILTVEVDRALLGRGDPLVVHAARPVLSRATSGDGAAAPRGSWPLVVAARPTLDGVWVQATFYDPGSGPEEGRALWFDPRDPERTVEIRTSSSVLYPQGPVRVGRHALVPTDEGFVVVPLVPAAAR